MIGAVEVTAAGPSSVIDGRYAIKREIARGAMGVVFEATHLTLRTAVALKTLTPAALDWRSGSPRLLREARVLAACRHPRIVRVQDAGVCPAHGPFLALEMLEGRSLDSYLVARQRLDVTTVARIGEQLCAAVAHVHTLGILHRDIKPSNVLVTRDEGGRGDSLRLIDFGIAGLPEAEDATSAKLTAAGELLGTVEYMAPEVLLHESVASPAADVYALGVLLYECLTGNVPFAGRPTAIISAHATGAAPPPIRESRADVPAPFESAILSALSRDPKARIASAEALGRMCLDMLDRPGQSLSLLEPAFSSPTAQARRQFPRAPYSAPARVVTKGGAVDGRTEDISEGGVLVVVSAECAEGESVTVRFPLPTSGRVLVVEGIARWTKTQRAQRAVGVAFRALAPDAVEDIRAYAEFMTRGGPREGLA